MMCEEGLVNDPGSSTKCNCPLGWVINSGLKGVMRMSECSLLDCAGGLSGSTAFVKNTPMLLECVGCTNGTYGTPAIPTYTTPGPGVSQTPPYFGCVSCSATSYCPGFTTAPVVYGFYTSAIAKVVAAACPPVAGNHSTQVIPALAVTQLGTWITKYASQDATIAVAIALSLSLLVIFIVSRYCAPIVVRRTVSRFYRSRDFFSSVNFSPDGGTLFKLKRPLGGLYSMLGTIAFLTAAVVLILRHAEDNITTIRSTDLLTESALTSILALPFRSETTWGRGVQVRIAAAGEAGRCALPLSMAYAGFGGSAVKISSSVSGAAGVNSWELQSKVSNCAATGISQMVYVCRDCSFTRSSALYFTFDSSCQSLDVQIGALDGEGASTAVKAVTPSSNTDFAGLQVVGMDVSVSLFHSTYKDTTKTAITNMRGYVVSNPVFSVTTTILEGTRPTSNYTTRPADGPPVYATKSPSTSALSLNILMPLDTVYGYTNVSATGTIMGLIASLIGLSGIVGVFAKFLGMQDNVTHKGRTKIDRFDEDGLLIHDIYANVVVPLPDADSEEAAVHKKGDGDVKGDGVHAQEDAANAEVAKTGPGIGTYVMVGLTAVAAATVSAD